MHVSVLSLGDPTVLHAVVLMMRACETREAWTTSIDPVMNTCALTELLCKLTCKGLLGDVEYLCVQECYKITQIMFGYHGLGQACALRTWTRTLVCFSI